MDLDRVYSNLKIEYGGIISSMIADNEEPKLVIKAR
jgi:hypothetical protein